MTPATIETAARRKYNSGSSTFFAAAEIYDLIYQAELEIARETLMLEGRTTTTSTASTQNYAYPSGVIDLKRVEYKGQKLKRITFSEDDIITLLAANSTTTGTPLYYYDWDKTIYLRPLPDTTNDQIRFYYYKEPAAVTAAGQTLEVPTMFHMCIVDYVTAEFAAKDDQIDIANLYFDKWYNKHLPAMKKWARKHRFTDSFNIVKDEDTMALTVLGPL